MKDCTASDSVQKKIKRRDIRGTKEQVKWSKAQVLETQSHPKEATNHIFPEKMIFQVKMVKVNSFMRGFKW